MPRIITIAREYGSGGRLIAQKVAQKVGLVYYDNEVIDLAAREMGMDVDAIRKVAEQKSSSFMYTMSSTPPVISEIMCTMPRGLMNGTPT